MSVTRRAREAELSSARRYTVRDPAWRKRGGLYRFFGANAALFCPEAPERSNLDPCNTHPRARGDAPVSSRRASVLLVRTCEPYEGAAQGVFSGCLFALCLSKRTRAQSSLRPDAQYSISLPVATPRYRHGSTATLAATQASWLPEASPYAYRAVKAVSRST